MKDPIDIYTQDFFYGFRNAPATGLSCPVCQGLLVVPRTGRPPVYCSNACKMKAYRVRAAVTKPQHLPETVTKHAAYGMGVQ